MDLVTPSWQSLLQPVCCPLPAYVGVVQGLWWHSPSHKQRYGGNIAESRFRSWRPHMPTQVNR